MTFGPTVDPVLLPPAMETMVRAYLLAPMSSTPIGTRLPDPDKEADTINGFLRLEEAGATKPNRFQYDASCILFGYSPDEDQAQRITRQAISLVGAARGQTINDSGIDWYVVGVMGIVGAQRSTDPDVILPRYRSMVTWRVAGQPWNP